jgi:hypothetical protein
MLADTRVSFARRPIDRGWEYARVIPASVTGFDPYRGRVCVAEHSVLRSWLDAPDASARKLNVDDRLVRELLFAVHDYLHVWAVQAIRGLRPEIAFGTGPIRASTLEDYAFGHILTEAVATVGLDYWYLAATDLNEVAPIGTRVRGLAVDYDERDAVEFRRFCPNLRVQDPSFFGDVARFYCTGRFPGFGKQDIAESPLLLRWMRHELQYGRQQRKYIRQWLAFLSEDALATDEEHAGAAIALDTPWKGALIDDLGAALWAKVKGGEGDSFASIDPAAAWASPRSRAPDFRFVNAHAECVPDRKATRKAMVSSTADGRRWLAYQWVSAHRMAEVEQPVRETLARLLTLGEFAAVLDVPLGASVDTPSPPSRDLFLPN